VPADFGARRLPTRAGEGCQLGLWSGSGGPEEAGELARARNGGHVARLVALPHPFVDAVLTVLGACGDLQDVVGQPLLALVERPPDAGRTGVVPGGLDKDPPCVRGAGLRDRPVHVALAGLLSRSALHRAGEPGEVGDLEHDDQRRERVQAAERAQAADQRPELLPSAPVNVRWALREGHRLNCPRACALFSLVGAGFDEDERPRGRRELDMVVTGARFPVPGSSSMSLAVR
jgi:hypothetical protein